MATNDDDKPGDEALTEEERRKRALALGQEIAQRWEPSRLSKFVVGGAGSGEKLDLGTQSEMERRLGGRFGDVRVFRGPFAEAVTKQHRADAVTIANTGMILVREGPRSDPKTALGKALLAHELTHVSQAQRGLHFALEGGESQGAPHEREAEAVESQVHAEETGQARTGGKGGGGGGVDRGAVVARVLELVDEWDRTQSERLGRG
ncbi:MAG: eCIS core domain-containing protein [Polyangia bacterium]